MHTYVITYICTHMHTYLRTFMYMRAHTGRQRQTANRQTRRTPISVQPPATPETGTQAAQHQSVQVVSNEKTQLSGELSTIQDCHEKSVCSGAGLQRVLAHVMASMLRPHVSSAVPRYPQDNHALLQSNYDALRKAGS